MGGASRARLVGGFAALVVLWIVVYWAWEPRKAGVTFAREGDTDAGVLDPAFAGDGPGTPASGVPEDAGPVGPDVAARPEASRGEAAPRVRGVIPPEFREYVVQEKDTMSIIARRIYGDPSKASAIARANPYVDPTRLRPGRVLRVPVDPDNVQGVSIEVPARGSSERGGSGEAVEYVVQKGDTLGSIARAHYGSIRFADLIFEANRAVLKSRNAIGIGQKLTLPPHPERGP